MYSIEEKYQAYVEKVLAADEQTKEEISRMKEKTDKLLERENTGSERFATIYNKMIEPRLAHLQSQGLIDFDNSNNIVSVEPCEMLVSCDCYGTTFPITYHGLGGLNFWLECVEKLALEAREEPNLDNYEDVARYVFSLCPDPEDKRKNQAYFLSERDAMRLMDGARTF